LGYGQSRLHALEERTRADRGHPTDTTLSGLSPFPEIWVPLKTAREMAAELGIMDQLGWLLSWRTRGMASWLVEGGAGGEVGGGVVGHKYALGDPVMANQSPY
jgi:hypothetical protein